ncbi:RNA pseudouridine synthase [Entomospira entomophila]|uniref:RNA pseudouridine synthase n=1 Tax=Entomospira entomophila TaxID=2719988 RepID=A0A968GBT3_9SPIO|nr:RNA pseudouridine synthase [Entomospira entomophilus]NIZ40733.1 RNA pseudouridine synthase [Entomospira entomophilus]WDI34946.1 RNA pseudouridine synthase [Entomospira entomophilus]
MNIPLVFENHEIWIFAKPAGLAVQPGKGVKISLIEELETLFEEKVYPVHRLDAATQGLIVVAKNPRVAHYYSKLFADATAVTKIYQAVVWGNAPKQFSITDHIVVNHKTKASASHVTKLESWQPHASLLKIELHTGRMHQIRIHLKKANLPILGDTKYGNFAFNRKLQSPLALFATELHIPAKNIHIQLPIKQELHHIKRALSLFTPDSIEK